MVIALDNSVAESIGGNINSPEQEVEDLEWSADQEIHLLYSLHGYKPVGQHKHFRMLAIQQRLSNAMNKKISTKAIWEKLNALYDLEALDEAEAEADATVTVETDFSLPDVDFKKLLDLKMKEPILGGKKQDLKKAENGKEHADTVNESKHEPKISQVINLESKEPTDSSKKVSAGKAGKKATKKKDITPAKDNAKDMPKRETLTKKEIIKEFKKSAVKEEDKKETNKKVSQENKKEINQEDKKEIPAKVKRESADKKLSEQARKDVEIKKTDPKKSQNQRSELNKSRSETPKQLRTEPIKRGEAKTPRSETPKLRVESVTKRNESYKKDAGTDKKKEIIEKNTDSKTLEKTPDSARGTKLRARDKREADTEKAETSGLKRERSRDSTSKVPAESEEPPAKKLKAPPPKSRFTRNSMEPQKAASPVLSSQKRRSRAT